MIEGVGTANIFEVKRSETDRVLVGKPGYSINLAEAANLAAHLVVAAKLDIDDLDELVVHIAAEKLPDPKE